MAIDKSKEFWTGSNAEDIIEYLNLYSENEIDKTALVKCDKCGSDVLTFQIDADEGAIKITCPNCERTRFLLDSEEYWEDCEPETAECSICNKSNHNIAVGFVYRQSGSVKWIYIGNRCTSCGVLGSYGDWKINYEPTDKMEQNV